MTMEEALKVFKVFEDKGGRVDIKKVEEVLKMVEDIPDNSPLYSKSPKITPDPEITFTTSPNYKGNIPNLSRTGDPLPNFYCSTSNTTLNSHAVEGDVTP